MTPGHELNNHPIHTSYRFPQKQSLTVRVPRGCYESHSNTNDLRTFLRDYRTLSVQPVSDSQSTEPWKAAPVDAVVEVSQQPLPASCLRACHFLTADVKQDVPPQTTASVSSMPGCEATVTPPPKALPTVWSDHDVQPHRSLYYRPG